MNPDAFFAGDVPAMGACSYHSEGESLCGEEKMRLGGSVHPQNGDIGGCKASRVATEDYTIDQVRTLGGPDHISCWATSS